MENLKERGVVVIMAVLFISFLLLITITLSAIFIPKVHSLFQVKNSTPALYAADSALEWCLYVARLTPPAATPNPPIMANGADYKNGIAVPAPAPFNAADCKAFTIKAIGTYQGVSRSLQINF